MPAPSAVTSNAKWPTEFDATKRFTSAIAMAPAKPSDRGRPLTDVDWNQAQMMLLWQLYDLAQFATVSGAMAPDLGKIVAAGGDNNFGVTGGGTAFEAMPYYLVGRRAAVLPWSGSAVWGSGGSEPARPWLHRRATAMTNTEIVDDDALYNVNALVGRNVYVATYDTIGLTWDVTGPHAIVHNLKGKIRLAAGANLLTTHAAGSYYWVAPSTPSGADRLDGVYLDVYEDEIAPAAVAGDPIADASMLVDVAGAPIETTRRMAVRQNVFYTQGGGVGDIPMTLVPGTADVYTYTDVSFKQHWVVPLALIQRRNGVAAIRQDDISDPRSIGGAGAQRALERLFTATFHGVTVATSGPPVKNGGNAAQLDIPARTLWHRGREFVLGATASFTAPTGGTAWAGSTAYVAYLDIERALVVVPLSTDPNLDNAQRTYLATFTTNGGGTDIGTVTDVGRYAKDFFQQLHFDAQGRLRKALKLRGGVALEAYDDATSPTLKGRVGYNLETSGTLAGKLASVAEPDVPAFHGQEYGGAGAMRGVLVDAAHDGSADTDVGANGLVTVLGAGVLNASGPTAPAVGYYNAVKTDKLVAPGLLYGNLAASGNKVVPIDFDMLVPACEGQLNWGFFANFNQMLALNINRDALFGDLNSALSTFPYSPDHPIFTMPLRVPRGGKLTSITGRFRNGLTSTASIGLNLQIFYRDAMSGGVLSALFVAISSVKSVTLNSANNGDVSVVFDAGGTEGSWMPYVNAKKRLYLGITIPSAPTQPAGSQQFVFHGAQIVGQSRGTGAPDSGASTWQTGELEGM